MSNDPSSSPPFAHPPGPTPAANAANNNTVKILLIVLGVVFFVGLVCVGVLAALLFPAVSAARQAARQMTVQNQMKQIGLAFHNYHSVYKQIPMAYVADAEGVPRNSWRTALLPFIEEDARYDQWSFDERWDGPTNSALHLPTPDYYASPMDSDLSSSQTHVFAVRSPEGLMPGAEVMKFRDCLDGLANTILAVYLPNRTTHWAEPVDVSPAELEAEIAGASPQAPVILLLADGGTVRLRQPIDPDLLGKLITRAGKETIDVSFGDAF